MSDVVVGYLGGESGHRAFFGGAFSRTRTTLLAVTVVATIAATPYLGWPAMAVGLAACGVVLALTARTHRGTILDRARARSRWRARARAGWARFVPYEASTWDALQQQASTGTKAERAATGAALAAMRANPDGADGMGWLACGTGEPGIAWHTPVGEEAYLSVAFEVSGQVAGIDSGPVLARAGEAWGLFLAAQAGPGSLVGTVQTLTRVLPSDTARHELWASLALDPQAPADAQESYAEVIARAARGAMVQRHYVVVTWPLTGEFVQTATRYGTGRDGWRALMAAQIDSVVRGLTDARMGRVTVLTARATAAVMLHQQDPSRPVDAVRTVDPQQLGVASHDEFSAHVVETTHYASGMPAQWWHRTCAIRAEAMSAGPRTQLWALDLLTGEHLADVLRSVSFHLRLVPADEAKAAARTDLTRDLADEIADRRAGRMVSDRTLAAKSAARRRAEDLAEGSPHHGVEWIGYVTLTAPSRRELADACRRLSDLARTGLGISALDWQDSYQSSASGTTWPIGRGLRPTAASVTSRMYDRLAGRVDQEALS